MLNTTEDGFHLVQNKKRKPKVQPSSTINNFVCPVKPDTDYILRRLANLREDIKASEYFTHCLQQFEKCMRFLKVLTIENLVCFGIGSFSSCLIALHQLAFILEFIEELKIKRSIFYDPILSEEEKHILENLSCELAPDNCEGKYAVESITVFYLPHCPKQLTNNLLWKNWNRTSLANVIIIGNSFENMQRNTPERFLQKDAEFVLRSSQWATEIPLANNFQHGDIFNDTSIHIFTDDKLQTIPEKYWLDHIEPKYDDSELITIELERKMTIS